MLTVAPSSRPTFEEILRMRDVSGHINDLPVAVEDEVEDNQLDLLKTIKLPKNLQQLTSSLPKSNYGSLMVSKSQVQGNKTRFPGMRKM
jgi:hypothetical protein